MSKWKCEVCESKFENFHAQGFDNKIYCPLCYFKKISADLQVENYKLRNELGKKRKEYQETYKDVRKEIKNYKEQLQQKDEVIDEIKNKCQEVQGKMDFDIWSSLRNEIIELVDLKEKILKSESFNKEETLTKEYADLLDRQLGAMNGCYTCLYERIMIMLGDCTKLANRK